MHQPPDCLLTISVAFKTAKFLNFLAFTRVFTAQLINTYLQKPSSFNPKLPFSDLKAESTKRDCLEFRLSWAQTLVHPHRIGDNVIWTGDLLLQNTGTNPHTTNLTVKRSDTASLSWHWNLTMGCETFSILKVKPQIKNTQGQWEVPGHHQMQ